ncbi:sigma-70 family RNA polymerase sigma factor [Mucilaginibacter sp.]|uniref:RNA polymerase sigma factor n=1 Tax=Mucilaginibacter sp. TaxID=1882438 RepID=UPI002631CF13|nr:sigma-70 family RNA polymerase sigma factor [Mucilaginibacter sp.]MDB4925284.1 polymerase subunit sigma-24 [Mucilaginibacter sp.]
MSAFHLLDDDQLAGQLRDGNELAFTEIYNRYWDKLYYLAHKLLKDTAAAEEIVQDVFFILWKKRETLAIKSLAAYLAAMTRYAVYRLISKDKKLKKQENIAGMSGVGATSEMNVDNKILLEIITGLSNKLPEKCRLVFQYNKLQDRSLADVAEQLNMSRKTAEAHLTKALKIIRTSLSNFMALLF